MSVTKKTMFVFIFLLAVETVRSNYLASNTTIDCPEPCECKSVEVNCRGKQLKSFPWKLPATTTILDLSDNHLEELPSDLLANLSNLQELILNKNKLKDLPPTLFDRNPHLNILDLSDNHLEELPSDLLANLSNLQILYVELRLPTSLQL
ncbi:phospholipase A2 inhibitor-like [Pocillopora verrucosa]|uniref:phospholipase A2 inhibitor-like n=1 Tax=Pocillopora verrucosa TaxID=203993 RepID=UPI00333F289E